MTAWGQSGRAAHCELEFKPQLVTKLGAIICFVTLHPNGETKRPEALRCSGFFDNLDHGASHSGRAGAIIGVCSRRRDLMCAAQTARIVNVHRAQIVAFPRAAYLSSCIKHRALRLPSAMSALGHKRTRCDLFVIYALVQ